MIFALLLLTACDSGPPPDLDPGFSVVGSAPEDGTEDAVESQQPELRFNAVTDPARCDADTLRLDALHDDDTVAFRVDAVIESVDGGVKLRLVPDAPMPTGWRYALTVRDGDDGCASIDGDVVRPFRAVFTVP